MSRRTERLGELIRREISGYLASGLGDPRIGFVTLTRVEVSADLSVAKVYLSVLEREGLERTTLQGLNSARKRIHAELCARLSLRRVPELVYCPDPGVKHSLRISSILSDLERERAKLPAAPESGRLEPDASEEEPDNDDG